MPKIICKRTTKIFLTLLLLFSITFTLTPMPSKASEPTYTLATDNDFEFIEGLFGMGDVEYQGKKGYFKYVGSNDYVEVPHVIKGVNVTSYSEMFEGSTVKGVKSTNKNVTRMVSMFSFINTDELNVEELDTSNVTIINNMFFKAQINKIKGINSWDTRNVENMYNVFNGIKINELNLNNWDISKVKNTDSMFNDAEINSLQIDKWNTSSIVDTSYMFSDSRIPVIDLSGWDTSNIEDTDWMFEFCQATTGYARTQEDADKLNNSEGKPSTLNFILKKIPSITLNSYPTEWTNQNITVTASTDLGTLNQDSYTFTENGTFKFIVTGMGISTTEKEVIITNIDKEKPKIKITIGEN